MSAPQAIDAAFLPDFPTPSASVGSRRPADGPRRAPRRLFGVVAVAGRW